MGGRKPLEEGCTGDIWCKLENHTGTITKGTKWTFGHIPLTLGQKKTLHERKHAAHMERYNWITERHGFLGTGENGQYHADGTHWKEAEREWQEHLKEKTQS